MGNFRHTGLNRWGEDGEADNDENPEDDWGYYQYQGSRSLSQVYNAEHDSSFDLELLDLEDLHTDSDVEGYLARSLTADEYRDSGRPGDCDVFKTCANLDVSGK